MVWQKVFISCLIISMFTACGFKGNLYLPEEGEEDDNHFGVIQTGITIDPPTNNTENNKDK